MSLTYKLLANLLDVYNLKFRLKFAIGILPQFLNSIAFTLWEQKITATANNIL
jgi:hypothetical protein